MADNSTETNSNWSTAGNIAKYGALGLTGGLALNSLGKKPGDPNQAANDYLNRIPGETKDYYDPYIQSGKDSLEKLKTNYSQMMDNPGDYFNKLGSGYKQSPGYEATLREALAGANNSAALGGAGGLGTPGAISTAAGAAGDVANKDYEQYINHILDLNKQGTQGEQTLETQGQNASDQYASMIASLRNTQGTNAANAVTARNQKQSQDSSNLFGTLGTIGGWIFGGPAGGTTGGTVGNAVDKLTK